MRTHVILFLFVLPTMARAETPKFIPLSQLLERALARNPELQALDLDAESLRAKGRQAGTWEDSHLELGTWQKQDPAGQTRFGRVALSQNVPRPGSLKVREATARDAVEIQELEKEKSALALRGRVLELIYLYQVAREKALHAQERVERFKIIDTYLRGRPFAAPQRRAEAGIVKAKLMLLRKELRELESDEQIAWNHLNLYLGYADEIETRAPWYRKGPVWNWTEISHKAEQFNPDLRQEKIRMRAQEDEWRLSRMEAWPGFALSAEYSRGNGASPETNYGLGISFPLPLWNGNRGAIAAAETAKKAQSLRARWASEKLRVALRSAWQGYQAKAQTLTELSPENLSGQEKEMKETDAAFKRGQVDLITYIEADNQHVESLNAILDAQIDFVSALRDLLFMVGEAPTPLEK